jgi:hypothetical protein
LKVGDVGKFGICCWRGQIVHKSDTLWVAR